MSPPKANSFFISVSDDDSDDPSVRKRPRLRRKRRGARPQGRSLIIPRRLILIAARWWPVLLFLPAAVMLLFQVSRIAFKPHLEVGMKREPATSVNESFGNLNRLDSTTRVIGGVRQPCLKLLPSEDIEKLDFPYSSESNYPIKELVYISDTGTNESTEDVLLLKHKEATRFNLFTGIQTIDEREKSFQMNETAIVHCGFYSKKGGFKISDEDKNYMQNCEAVVSTCSFGGGDDLYAPIGVTEATLQKVCYVAFWDEITRLDQEAEGKRIGDEHMIGKWRVVIVKDLPFSDQRLNGKIPKLLSHRLFPRARYSIWVDSKSQFRRDPLGVFEALLWRSKSVLAISEHGARSSLYDEAKAIVKKNKATPEEIEVQISQYRRDGFPDDKRFRGKKALSEASIIVREHTVSTNLLMCLWFNEVVRFTSRDQVSFPYVLRRLGTPRINMFPVCVRKDLVNSMGHKRKVKPLVTL